MILNDHEPLHHRRLDGAARLVTPALRDITAALKLTAERCLLSSVYGPAGTGKSFAIHTAARAIGIRSVRVEFFGTTRQKQIVAALLEQLAQDKQGGTQPLLEQRLLDYLRVNRTMIVVDEAQRLTSLQFEYFRHLQDRCEQLAAYEGGHGFALVLAGGNGCAARLRTQPMLESRISSWVETRPLNDTQIRELIPTFHPLYRDAEPELLLRVDDEYAHGVLRNWADFTLLAAEVASRLKTKTLTSDVISNVYGISRGSGEGA